MQAVTLRRAALVPLCEPDPTAKADAVRALPSDLPVGEDEPLAEPPGIPGRPQRPLLVAHTQVRGRGVGSVEGRAALLHALAHIEFNAIDLALDIIWRFAGLPAAFYTDWLRVAREEALHFSLLRAHLQSLGFDYGDFPAHAALWEMAERTRHDVLDRLALVPRTLEARGLDASPAVRAKLAGVGDAHGAGIIDLILHDEIGHVAVGNRWYRFVCAQRGLDVHATYAELAALHEAPRLRGPFNWAARRAAGFDAAELAALGDNPPLHG